VTGERQPGSACLIRQGAVCQYFARNSVDEKLARLGADLFNYDRTLLTQVRALKWVEAPPGERFGWCHWTPGCFMQPHRAKVAKSFRSRT